MEPDYPTLSLFIDGQHRQGDAVTSLPVLDPATGATLAMLPCASDADIDEALAVAQRTAPSWRSVPAEQRGAILKRAAALLRERAETIARVASREAGKPLAEARMEVAMAASTLEWFGEEARRAYGRVIQSHGDGVRMTVRREPIGPVASFSPWNFPIANPARKLAPALAAGCPVILKPAEETPASALAVAGALIDAGLPTGAMAILFGQPATISSRLIASDVIRKISFTGSVAVGRALAAAAAGKGQRATMELGGHGPVLVAADAELDRALDLLVASKFRNAGQVCVAPTRFLVEAPLYEAFLAGFVARAAALRVGAGLADGTQMGPLIRERRRIAIAELIDDARLSGAEIACGGDRLDRAGFFFQPTVLAQVPLQARVMNEEPFGPIAIINPVESMAAAIDEANRLPFGLAAYGFTTSQRTAMLIEERLEAGMIGINTTRIAVPEAPFGGIKASGDGSEEGTEGLDAYYVPKFVNAA